ncbi:S8 family peptidase [Bacillus manliponensis]|uniref:S8 family peptidase n=1 Tax=Bacillus manliponensis TaxID=574376 RepID=UPI0035116E47
MKNKFIVFLSALLIIFGGFFSNTNVSHAETTSTSNEYVPNELIVKFKDDAPINKIKELQQSTGATIVSSDDTLGFHVIKLLKGTVEENVKILENNPYVEYAEPNYYFHAFWNPNDTYFNNQYGLQKIQAPQAWDSERSAPGVKIAIIDTGVQSSHPDLAAKVTHGHDYVDNDNRSDDGNGHGTHCAGIAGAITNNNVGIAGVAPQASIYAVRVLNNQGSGTLAAVAQGIREGADSGAKVISLSLGATTGGTSLQQAVQYAWNKGAVIVAAAGNSGNTRANYPAYYNEVIAVASTDSADRKSSFSNYGSWVDVAAPGSSIYSTYTGNSYRSLSGTSMAAPHVAGLAALLANQGYNNVQIRQIIETTSDKISGTGSYWTHGRVNASKAVQYGKQLKENKAS